MRTEKPFITSYDKVKDFKHPVDMESTELAGYYLANYNGDPIGMLNDDIYNQRVPSVKGRQAEYLIKSIRGS